LDECLGEKSEASIRQVDEVNWREIIRIKKIPCATLDCRLGEGVPIQGQGRMTEKNKSDRDVESASMLEGTWIVIW
jgi:hypothetical protein